jgi:hypothetical protein
MLPESAQLDDYAFGVSMVVQSKRYLTLVGGENAGNESSEKEWIRVFDHLQINSGWRRLRLTGPYQTFAAY